MVRDMYPVFVISPRRSATTLQAERLVTGHGGWASGDGDEGQPTQERINEGRRNLCIATKEESSYV
jgi:hypothetical protein